MTTVPSAAPDASLASRPGSGRRWLLTVGLVLLAGPLLFDLGYALHPSLPDDVATAMAEAAGARELLALSKVMVAFGGLLLIALVLVLRQRLVRDRGRALSTVAVVLAAVGLASNSLSQATHGYLMFWATDPAIEPDTGLALLEVANGATDLVTLPVSFFAVPVFAVGLLLFAVSLWRAGTVPRWVPIAIVAGGVGAGAIGTGPAMLVVMVVDLAAFGAALIAAQSEPGSVTGTRPTAGVAT